MVLEFDTSKENKLNSMNLCITNNLTVIFYWDYWKKTLLINEISNQYLHGHNEMFDFRLISEIWECCIFLPYNSEKRRVKEENLWSVNGAMFPLTAWVSVLQGWVTMTWRCWGKLQTQMKVISGGKPLQVCWERCSNSEPSPAPPRLVYKHPNSVPACSFLFFFLFNI